MFIENNSTNEYFTIINRNKETQKDITKKSQLTGYFEKHHIIPKSMGGSNIKENTVFLSAEDHFKCHKLLIKMVISDKDRGKMWSSLWRMMNKQSRNQNRDFTFTDQEYATARMKHAEEHRNRMLGDNNPFKNKKHTDETKKRMSESKKGKTWEDIYGIEGAAAKKRKTSVSASKPHGPQHKTSCLHCGKIGGFGLMKRWHGDNCKSQSAGGGNTQ